MMIIAHRGASGSAPENTLAAFRKAIDLGADWLELDVCVSKDGEIMVFHDGTLRRTTNGRGRVRAHTRSELQQLDAGSFFHPRFAGEKIPTLREVIDLVKPSRTGLLVEMKTGRHLGQGFEENLVALLKQERMLDRCFVMSFNHSAVRRVKEREPGVKTLLVVGRRMRSRKLIERVQSQNADGISILASLASRTLVEKMRRHGLTTVVWTINSTRQMKRWIARDIDGITTNFPKRLVKLLR